MWIKCGRKELFLVALFWLILEKSFNVGPYMQCHLPVETSLFVSKYEVKRTGKYTNNNCEINKYLIIVKVRQQLSAIVLKYLS